MLFIILNLVTVFDTLLILFLIYYGGRFLLRLFGPQIVERAADKIVRDMQQQERARQHAGRQQGSVTIDKQETAKKTFSRNQGEYVDFEEIK